MGHNEDGVCAVAAGVESVVAYVGCSLMSLDNDVVCSRLRDHIIGDHQVLFSAVLSVDAIILVCVRIVCSNDLVIRDSVGHSRSRGVGQDSESQITVVRHWGIRYGETAERHVASSRDVDNCNVSTRAGTIIDEGAGASRTLHSKRLVNHYVFVVCSRQHINGIAR